MIFISDLYSLVTLAISISQTEQDTTGRWSRADREAKGEGDKVEDSICYCSLLYTQED